MTEDDIYLKNLTNNNANNNANDNINTRLNIIAFLGSVCLFFSTLEYLIPKPVPFIRIGLANIPIILCIRHFSFKEITLLTLLKVLGAGILNGTLASYVFLFSTIGSYSSLLCMYLLSRIPKKYMGYIGISIAGSLVSNVMQLLLSVYFIFGKSSIIIVPPFLIVGFISGLFIGIFATKFESKSKWLSKYINKGNIS